MNKEKKVAYIIFACFFLISSVALLILDAKTGGEKDFFLPLLLNCYYTQEWRQTRFV